MSTKVTEPTLSEAFEVGRREGLKEAFSEIQKITESWVSREYMQTYLKARIKSIHDFEAKNPFKQKDTP